VPRLLLAVVVTGANVQDRDGDPLLPAGLKDRYPRLELVWADGGYSGGSIGSITAVALPSDRSDIQHLSSTYDAPLNSLTTS
jgi:hypothetical protein